MTLSHNYAVDYVNVSNNKKLNKSFSCVAVKSNLLVFLPDLFVPFCCSVSVSPV